MSSDESQLSEEPAAKLDSVRQSTSFANHLDNFLASSVLLAVILSTLRVVRRFRSGHRYLRE